MRILNGVLCLLMLAFAAVQINDPDAVLWMIFYAVPALWAGLAAWRPGLFRKTAPFAAEGLCLLAVAGITLAYWPREPGWWRQEIWWETETAREGMGLMIATGVLVVVALTAWRARTKAGVV